MSCCKIYGIHDTSQSWLHILSVLYYIEKGVQFLSIHRYT